MDHKIFLCLIILIFLFGSSIKAQPASPEFDKGWFTLAAGAGFPLDLNGALTANFGRTKFWQVALQSNADFTISGEATQVSSLSASKGISSVHRIGRAAISAGAGIAWGQHDPDPDTNERKKFITGALVANAEVNITPAKELGLGLSIFGNLNPQLSSLGIMLSLSIEGHK